MSEQNIASPENVKNRPISKKSLSQSKLSKITAPLLIRHNYESQLAKQMQQKVRSKFFHLGQRDKPFFLEKQSVENDLFNLQIVQKNMKIQGLLKKIHALFIHNKIPEFYAYYFLKRLIGANQQTIQDAIHRQINWIKQKQCHYQIIIPTIKARQGCLKQLQHSLVSLFNSTQQESIYRSFRQQIQHYRRLTSLVIRQIKSWKQYLESINNNGQSYQNPTFIYKDEDYFITLLNDNSFIFNSFLSNYLNFSQKNDPFIMRPYIDDKNKNRFAQIFAVTPEQKDQFIVLLNYLAQQRAKYLRRKIQTKEQRLKDIQKIYQSNKGIEGLHTQIFISKSKKSPNKQARPPLKLQKQIDFVDNSAFQTRRQQISQYDKKMSRMKKIKSILSMATPIINKNKLINSNDNFRSQRNPAMGKTLLQSPIKLKFRQVEYDDDFTKMMRKKQLQILQESKNMKITFQRPNIMLDSTNQNVTRTNSLRSVKINDSLSKSRSNLNNKSCLNQLQAIISTLETNSPLKLSNYKILPKSQQEQQNFIYSPKKLKKLQPTKSLLQHNQEIIFQMRNNILKEIEDEKHKKQKMEMLKKLQNQRVQNILQQKLQKQVLKHIQQEKDKRVYGRQQLIKNWGRQSQFGYQKGYQSQISKSKKLSELQFQLKNQFQLKLLREVHEQLKRKTQISDIQLQKMRQNQRLQKLIKKLSEKQQRERRYLEIERQERARAMKTVVQLQQMRKKQIEKQMQQVMMQEKQKLQKYSLAARAQVEVQMRQRVKQKMFNNLKQQKYQYEQKKITQQQLRMKEQQYRQQVRRKLQKQYQIEEIIKRQAQRQQKQKKLKLIQQKLTHFDQSLQKSNFKQSPLVKTHLKTVSLQQARQKLLQDVKRQQQNEQYRKIKQKQKIRMREQFEIELFAFMRPQYVKKQNQSQFKTKDYKNITDDIQFLNKKQLSLQQSLQALETAEHKQPLQIHHQIKNSAPKSLKESQLKTLNNSQINHLRPQQTQSQRFERFSSNVKIINKKNEKIKQKQKQKQTDINLSNKEVQQQNKKLLSQKDEEIRQKLKMTVEQYTIYKMKKQLVNKKRKYDEEQNSKKERKQRQEIEKVRDSFQLLEFKHNNKKPSNDQIQNILSFYDPENKKINNGQISKSNHLQSQPIKVKQRKQIDRFTEDDFKQNDSQLQNQFLNQIIIQPKIKQTRIYPQKQVESNNLYPHKQLKQLQQIDSQVMKLTVHSHMNENAMKKYSKFMTSQSQEQQSQNQIKLNLRKKQKAKRQYQKQKQNQINNQQQNLKKIQRQTKYKIKNQVVQNNDQSEHSLDEKTFIKVRQIENQKLQQFMKDHFQHMPRLIKKLNLYKRDELIKVLRQDYKSFTILQYIQNYISLGIIIIAANENKKNIRSFNILHVGPYVQDDTMTLLRNSTSYIFKNDPVQQLTFSLFYLTDETEQNQFIKKFQKLFDAYGVIFQKKIFNTQFQRKHVIRRTLNDKPPTQKEKVNCGQLWIQNDLIVTYQFLGYEKAQIQQSGIQFGSYGVTSILLSKYIPQQTFKQITSVETKNIHPKIKHLAKQSASLKSNQQKICNQQNFSFKQFPNPFQLNLQLHAKNKPLVQCLPSSQQKPIKCIWNNINLPLQISYPFTALKNKFTFQDDQYTSEYFRFIVKKQKTFLVKSALYSSQVVIIPCKNTRFKIFFLSSHQYDSIINSKGITKKDNLAPNIDVYLKLFFGNLNSHQVAKYQTLWIPQFKFKKQYNCSSDYKYFIPESQASLTSQMEFYYTQYLENSLIYKPTHRDFVVSPPYIMGLIDSQMQLASQGSTLFSKRVGIQELLELRQIAKIIDYD